jgi:PAS domain S-box-containing protein
MPGRSASQVLITEFDSPPLEHMTLDELIERHELADDDKSRSEITRLMRAWRGVASRKHIETLEGTAGHFRIEYDNNEAIQGDFFGVRKGERLPVVIWAPAFGLSWDAGIRRLYLAGAQGHRLIALCYDPSGVHEDTTFSRYCQDLTEVLSFVSELPFVDPERIGLAGISYSCNVAAKLAADNESIRSLFLMLPSMDIIEMLNKFRVEADGVSDAIQKFSRAEKGWRYREISRTNRCDYFGLQARAAHMVDMVVNPAPQSLLASGFLANLAKVAVRKGAHVQLAIGDNDCLVDLEKTNRAVGTLKRIEPRATAVEVLQFSGGRNWKQHSSVERSYNAVATAREMKRVCALAWSALARDLSGEAVSASIASLEQVSHVSRSTTVEAEFEKLLRRAPVGLAVTTRRGELRYANDAFYEMLGFDPSLASERDALTAGSIEVFYEKPDDRQRLLKLLSEKGEVDDFRVRGKRRNGSAGWFSLSCKPIKFQGNDCLETTLRDINAVVHAEEVKQEDLRDREREIRERDEFVDRLGHDLTGPTKRLCASIREIIEHGFDEVTFEEVEGGAELLKRLTSNMLSFSRIRAGRTRLNLDTYNRDEIEMLVDIISKSYRSLLQEQKKRLVFEIAKDLPEIKTDRVKLEAVLVNLIDNALKFTEPERGEIRVSVSTGDEGTIKFVVWDNGRGIGKEFCEQVFGKYEQADTQDGKHGLGLGLFIVKKYTETLGGCVLLESKLGGPTEFVVTLPSHASTRQTAVTGTPKHG